MIGIDLHTSLGLQLVVDVHERAAHLAPGNAPIVFSGSLLGQSVRAHCSCPVFVHTAAPWRVARALCGTDERGHSGPPRAVGVAESGTDADIVTHVEMKARARPDLRLALASFSSAIAEASSGIVARKIGVLAGVVAWPYSKSGSVELALRSTVDGLGASGY